MAFTNSTQFSPTVFGLTFVNKYSKLDKTMLQFSMWKTTIKITIYPVIESSDSYSDDQVKFDKKNGLSIYLTATKAHLFAQLLREFKNDPEKISGKGVPSGQSLITIEFNPSSENTPCIAIRKINPDSGSIEQSYSYELSDDLSMIIEDYDPSTGTFNKNYEMFRGHDLDMIILQLEQYAAAMTNSMAFSVTENLYPHFEKIASKLGVELYTPYGGGSYRSNSYFASNPGMNQNASPETNSELRQYTGKGLESLMAE